MNIIPKVISLITESFSISKENCFFIEGQNIKDKESCLNEFYKKLKAPEQSGNNLDAFSDIITDLSWLNLKTDITIIYSNFHKFRNSNSSEWNRINDILFDAVDYWKQNNIKMTIVFV